MLEVRRGADLREEPLAADDRRELGAEHLDRDVAIVLDVVREVDRGHPARAKLALDAVPAIESRRKLIEDRGHGPTMGGGGGGHQWGCAPGWHPAFPTERTPR